MTTPYTKENPLPGWKYSRRLQGESVQEHRIRVGLTPRTPRLLWPLWLCACFAIGAAFAYYF